MRTKVAASIAAALLTGTVLSVITAAPANAADACHATFHHEDRNGRVAKLPARGSDGCTMRQGDSGDAVKALQVALKQCYGHNLSIDGQFGPRTRDALISAQKNAGTAADGIYGPNTFSKIKWPYFAEAVATCHPYGV
ncbi:peptidoglycan-binding domain-containing protein [Nocardia pneumoniae]|uniref:peptidoglycan-binding domain-containing protein n=1 Tax=Nocardia pneumoniae TaxID=228601 RepID=UPI00030CE95E|nr:peptidoglycan-binding domain-containing protein [Nocardia pneumoniae]